MKRKPSSHLLLSLNAALLAGCAATPANQTVRIEPVLQVNGESISTARDHYQSGRGAWQRGDLRLARTRFAAALRLDPNQVDAINGMAAVLSAKGMHEDALQLLHRAVRLAPDEPVYRRNLQRLQSYLAAVPEAARALSPRAESAPRTSRGAGRVVAEPGRAAVVLIAPSVYELQTPGFDASARGLATGPEQIASADRASAAARSAIVAQPAAAASQAADRVVSSAKPAPVRVMISNGIGHPGAAARSARALLQHGGAAVSVVRINNFDDFTQRRTRLLYAPGFRAQAAQLLRSLPPRDRGIAQLVESSALPAGVDVRLVLGTNGSPISKRRGMAGWV